MNEKISVPTDSEGYYSLECPYCKDRFKAFGGDVDEEDTLELFCPYCGLVKESNSFLPEEVIKYAQALAMNYVKQQINKTFKKTSRQVRGKGIRFDFKKLKEEQPEQLIEDDKLELIELHCCDKSIKVYEEQTLDTIFCPYCGVN